MHFRCEMGQYVSFLVSFATKRDKMTEKIHWYEFSLHGSVNQKPIQL